MFLLGNEQWRHWDKTMSALGVDKYHFGDPAGEAAERPDYRAATVGVEEIMSTKTFNEWHEIFQAHDVWHAPINRFEDMLVDEQANAVGAFTTVPGVNHKLIALQLSRQRGLPGPSFGAPELSEHTDEVLGELGYSAQEIAALRAAGVTK